MTPARRRYERVLGAALLLVGLVCVVPISLIWMWASRMYTVGLSVDAARALPLLAAIIIGFGALVFLGGFALLRRP